MQGIFHTSFLLLHFALDRGADTYYGNTTGELGQTLLQFSQKIASGFVESAIKSNRKQTDGEETTDGVESAWSTSSPAGYEPGVGEHLPALVSGFPPSRTGQESGVIPRNLPLSVLSREKSGAISSTRESFAITSTT